MHSKRAQCVCYVPMSSRCISAKGETQMFTIVIIKCSLCDGPAIRTWMASSFMRRESQRMTRSYERDQLHWWLVKKCILGTYRAAGWRAVSQLAYRNGILKYASTLNRKLYSSTSSNIGGWYEIFSTNFITQCNFRAVTFVKLHAGVSWWDMRQSDRISSHTFSQLLFSRRNEIWRRKRHCPKLRHLYFAQSTSLPILFTWNNINKISRSDYNNRKENTRNEWWTTNIQSQRRRIGITLWREKRSGSKDSFHLNAGIERQFWKLFGKQWGIITEWWIRTKKLRGSRWEHRNNVARISDCDPKTAEASRNRLIHNNNPRLINDFI